jgi:hypothetical protein
MLPILEGCTEDCPSVTIKEFQRLVTSLIMGINGNYFMKTLPLRDWNIKTRKVAEIRHFPNTPSYRFANPSQSRYDTDGQFTAEETV